MTKKKAVHAGLAQIDSYSRSAHLLVFNNEAFLFNLHGSALNEALIIIRFSAACSPKLKKNFHTQTKEPTKDLKLISHGHWPTKVLFIFLLYLRLENHWVKTKVSFRSSIRFDFYDNGYDFL